MNSPLHRSRAGLVRCLVATALAAGSLAVASGATGPANGRVEAIASIKASVETPSRFDDEAGGDADADDPAIWAHPSRPRRSLVLGTLKNGGLDAYDLSGRLVQHLDAPDAPSAGLEPSRFNNVDIALDVTVDGRRRDLAVVSDRGRDRLRIYAISPAGAAAPGGRVLRDITADNALRLFNRGEAAVEDQATGYGLTVRPSGNGTPWVVVSRRHTTRIGLFRLDPRRGGTVSYHRVDTVDLPAEFSLPGGGSWVPCGEPGEPPQVEGMVVDTRHDVLYAAQEVVGVWRIPLQGASFGVPALVEKVREFGVPATYEAEIEECVLEGEADTSKHLSADAEGLTIAYGKNGKAVMLASSQGDSTYALYRLWQRPAFVRSLRFVAGPAADSVENSDGAAVLTTDLGPQYPAGLLVLHDGENTPVTTGAGGEPRPDTDFKLVRWDRVVDAGL